MVAMRRALVGGLLWFGLLASCNGEPTYSGVSFVTYNYTPWNLEPVRLSDASGSVASSSTLAAGGGEGRISCCYTFRGTDFTVKWSGGDPDLLRKHLFDDKFEEVMFKKEAAVHFPAAKVPEGDGTLILELHIYPDEHMELALSRKLAGQVRIPIVDTSRWLYAKYRDELVRYDNAGQLANDVAKVTQKAWVQYRIEDAEDMRAYMYLYFVVASDFDKDAGLFALLKDTSRKPGDFGRAVFKLSEDRLAQIKAAGTAPGDKNV
ncbi:hypothetical protein [Achromobacter arsenitoxydans]|uniref:hypothetical protein n=1 Tax=Achromobacter arsenitoxydans TaxID=1147684 RepID=UPI001EE672AB|nr:hypothetical protein [Achromobacter arsenitoxydans]